MRECLKSNTPPVVTLVRFGAPRIPTTFLTAQAYTGTELERPVRAVGVRPGCTGEY